MTIGFVILSHRDPAQLLRLVQTLNRLYDDPPIACHHDMAQCPLDPSGFPGNVRFVDPSIRTGWAKWSVVRGFIAALRLLYADTGPERAGPDWFVMMSAAVAAPGLSSSIAGYLAKPFDLNHLLDFVCSIIGPASR